MKKKLEFSYEKAAEEVKKFLDEKKFDLVDYSYVNMEVYPPADSEEYPHISFLCKEWEEFFNKADRLTQDDGSGFPDEEAKELETKAKKVEKIVNGDDVFWASLRDVIIPLYDRSPHFEAWKERWKSVSFLYDPVGMDVVTTQMWTNKETGERTRGDELRRTSYPPGFIIRIN